MDLALNNLQRLICHKNQPTKSDLHSDYEAKAVILAKQRERLKYKNVF